jgi:hypothetical protein
MKEEGTAEVLDESGIGLVKSKEHNLVIISEFRTK